MRLPASLGTAQDATELDSEVDFKNITDV